MASRPSFARRPPDPRPFDATAADYERFMRLALAEADAAGGAGDVPVGAVVIGPGGEVVATGQNRREQDGDPLAHAEVVALRAAARATGQWRLIGCTLVVTLEPCPMCAGAIINARVPRVVFGCGDLKAGAAGGVMNLLDHPKLNHRPEVIPGVLAEECAERLRAFFKVQRQLGKK